MEGSASERRAEARWLIERYIDEDPTQSKQSLNLGNLSLSSLPTGLDRLHVRELILSLNPLTHLPLDAEGGFPGLETLYLSRTPIEDLNRLGKLTSLRFLYLVEAGLSRMPDGLDASTQLEVLDMSRNRLTEPPDLSAWPRLQVLSLAKNSLSSLSEASHRSAVSQLRKLDLTDNQFAVLPNLSAFTALTGLYLSKNLLTVPPEVRGCRALREIYLQGNQLTEMPDVRGLANLRFLGLQNNRLTELPSWVEDLPSSLTIHLTGNPLNAESLAMIDLARYFGTGPQFVYFPGAVLPDGRPTSLREQAGIWLSEHPGMSAERRKSLRERWEGFEQEPNATEFTGAPSSASNAAPAGAWTDVWPVVRTATRLGDVQQWGATAPAHTAPAAPRDGGAPQRDPVPSVPSRPRGTTERQYQGPSAS